MLLFELHEALQQRPPWHDAQRTTHPHKRFVHAGEGRLLRVYGVPRPRVVVQFRQRRKHAVGGVGAAQEHEPGVEWTAQLLSSLPNTSAHDWVAVCARIVSIESV